MTKRKTNNNNSAAFSLSQEKKNCSVVLSDQKSNSDLVFTNSPL